ncbi:hypothetical protein JOF29_007224 [Kribbella aluminosa]|uniref:Uncharacterized protein n=1 Tax=Kribbella aluminosa TaxID=416017 RepID=A0ABS4UWU2_9ACTN|nr:hypothetical protein [Kribbella aluminosa]MBP2356114.1 hypothetical protein [Kribbella aluminosa]
MNVERPKGALGLSRRRLLQGSVAAATGLAFAGAMADPSAASPQPSGLSVGDRAFLERGLQHLAWIATPNATTATGAALPYPSAEQFNGSGFTGPCYYTAGPDDMYSTDYERRLDTRLWAAAQFPAGRQQQGQPPSSGGIVGPPQPGEQLLSPTMRADRDNFFSACFGDEERYSEDLVGWLKQYYDLLREQSPDTLVYNNQWTNEWTDDQLRHYIQTCHPDLLSWDRYYFSRINQFSNGSVTPLYDGTYRYRRLAREGLDGTGAYPINFGQYTQGYTGPAGPYILSESQLAVVPYVSWAMGAKLLNLFRWTWQTSPANVFLLNDSDGRLTPIYDVYAALNAEMQRFSPYLVRLQTNEVSIKRGSYDPAAPKPTPKSQVPDWTAGADPCSRICGLDVTNIGGSNGGLPGDVLIGSFQTLPGLRAAERNHWVDSDGSAFMLVNALTQPNIDSTSSTGTGGRSIDTRQRIRVTLDLGAEESRLAHGLYQIDGGHSHAELVRLQRAGESRFTFDVELGGGRGALFIWS